MEISNYRNIKNGEQNNENQQKSKQFFHSSNYCRLRRIVKRQVLFYMRKSNIIHNIKQFKFIFERCKIKLKLRQNGTFPRNKEVKRNV